VKTARTRYAKSGNARITCQVVGQGPQDLGLVLGCLSNLEPGHPGQRRHGQALRFVREPQASDAATEREHYFFAGSVLFFLTDLVWVRQ
jgi:hypothetical protein